MSATFELPTELNIYTAADTAQLLLHWFTENHTQQVTQLQLDGHAVAEVDAAGLQLLVSLHNSCTTHALQWSLTQASQTLAAACSRLGIPTGTSA
jgi:ABC-type transporter Mla MlaB component